MPRKSGHKLLYELRRDKELSRIPVLIVTAHAQDELGKQDLNMTIWLSPPGSLASRVHGPKSPKFCPFSVYTAFMMVAESSLRNQVHQERA